jgi:glycosyltransferase involved in cell wall biosynthesis
MAETDGAPWRASAGERATRAGRNLPSRGVTALRVPTIARDLRWRLRRQRLRILQSGRERVRLVGRRLTPDWLRQVAGDRPRRMLRLSTVALMIGDHRAAAGLASPRRGLIDEHDLFVFLVSRWELGETAEVRATMVELERLGGGPRRRALARFHLYLEDPERAEDILGSIEPETSRALAQEIAQGWRRAGHPDRAIDLLDRVLEVDPNSSRSRELRSAAKAERSLLGWSWSAVGSAELLAPVGDRVLHIVARSLPHHRAGATYRTHYLVQAQRKAGVDAHVATQAGFAGPSEEAFEEHLGVPYHRLLPESRSRRIDHHLEHHLDLASSLVERLRPAVLHPASDYRNATVALQLGRRFDLPVVYEVRGFPEEYLRRRPGSKLYRDRWVWRRELEAECWRRADRIVTLAEVMKKHIISKGVEPERVVVIPNSVDTEIFKPRPRDRELAERLGIRTDETVLGYVSGFWPYEGIRYLIEAAARLTYQGRAVKVLLVGAGPDRPHLEQLARRLRVPDKVVFPGRVDHATLPSYYGLIDVFVVPRTTEATTELVTPLKPFEAMAMEKPVIVAGTKALRELIVEGETGLSYEPENSSGLTDVVVRLIDSPAERQALGQGARNWVAQNRSWLGAAERYLELYASLTE